MHIIYYVETNLICIAILFLIQSQLHKRSEKFSAEMIVFQQLIWTTIILCASDMVAGTFRGKMVFGARAIIEISNLVFFEALAIISYLWMIYVNTRLNFISDINNKKRIMWSIPVILFTVVCISNPWTHIFFSIDANNLYSRGIGIIFHWIVTWLYLIIPTVQTIWVISREKNKQRRQEIVPLLYFVIPPFFASTIQMFFYGVTSSQVGVTFSILIIFLVMQRSQIMTDALTGLNNRHGLANYLQSNFSCNLELDIFVLMLDLNGFKQINDKLGHIIGDRALKDAADALKQACKSLSERLFLCRFGGDEFVIIIHDSSQDKVEHLKEHIQKEFEKKNLSSGNSYILDTSIGIAKGRCSDSEDVEQLLHIADDAMYNYKKRVKHSFN
ncbi:MAG: diguanylate cyclase [Angelakisella sp.]